MKNITTSKDETVIQDNLKKMEKDILASLYHSVYNKSAKIQHQYCPPSWCKYQMDKVNKTTGYNHQEQKKKNTSKIYEAYATFIQKIVRAKFVEKMCNGTYSKSE